MKRRLKAIPAFIIISAMLLCFFSCRIRNDGGTSNGGNQDGGDNRATVTLVYARDIPSEAISYFSEKITAKCGANVVSRAFGDESYGENVIYIGDLPTELSQSAYLKLGRLDTVEKGDVRYLANGGGSAIAIACDVDSYGVLAALYTAIDETVASFIDEEGKITANQGTLTSGIINIIEYQRAIDEELTEEKFENLYNDILTECDGNSILADEIYGSFEKIYALYTDDLISWMANLYDPESGGFYYSNSARDTIGYLPDIESTAQMMDIIISSGLCSMSDLPDWFKSGMVNFVKGLQDENGYFYHPQWGKAMTDSNPARRSRDLSKALSLLNRLGAKPTYDTPTGVEGDGVIPAAKSLTRGLSGSAVSAVSKVLAVASLDYADSNFASADSFRIWLGTVDINSSSYQSYFVGDRLPWATIKTRDAQLKAQGKEGLVDIFVDWLYEKQNPTTGIWTLNSYADIDGINGLFKILSGLNSLGAELKYPMEALNSTLTVLNDLRPEDVIRVCDVFNIWNIFVMAKQNVNSYGTNQSDKIEVNDFCSDLLVNGALGLANSAECLAIFLKPDGSMSYSPTISAPTSHGMPVAVQGSIEGDVNGTALGTVGTIVDLMRSLGLTYIPFFTKGDGIEFISLLEDMGNIVKHEAPIAVAEDFEDEDVGDGCSLVSSSSITSSGGFGIVELPEGGKALLMHSENDGGDYIYIPETAGILSASCFTVESDIRIVTPDYGAVAQLQLSSEVYWLNISASDTNGDGVIDENDDISLYEQSSSDKSNWVINSFGAVAKVGEWFKLRVEYYPGEKETVRIKIFVNGELIAVTDTYHGKLPDGSGDAPASNYNHARFIIPSNKKCDLYIDNLLVTKSNDPYTPSDIPEGDPRFGGIVINVDSPASSKVTHGFDSDEALESYVTSLGDGSVAIEGGALILAGNGAAVTLPVNLRSPLANCGVLETEVTVSADTVAGAKYEILFETPLNQPILRLYLGAINKGGELRLGLYEDNNGKVGDLIGDFDAPIGEKFDLGIHYYAKEQTALIYVEGDLVARTDALASGADTYRFTNLTVTSLSADGSIALDNLVCERRGESFELATSPDGEEKVYDFSEGTDDLIITGDTTLRDGILTMRGGSSLTLPINRRSQSGASALLYLDVSLSSLEDMGGFTVKFEDGDGNTILAFRFTPSDGKISICELTELGDYDPVASTSKTAFTLAIEYYPDKEVCEVFVDGVCLLQSSLTYLSEPADTVTATVTISSTLASGLSLDNLKGEMYDKLYLPASPTGKNPESGAEKYTFESSSTGSLPQSIYTDFRSAGASLRIKESRIGEAVSKVLAFNTAAGNNDSLYIPVTKKTEGANGVAFEADMRMDMLATTDAMEIYLQVGSNHATRVTVKYMGDGKMLIYDNVNKVYFSVEVNSGEWFNFRLEYSVTSTDYTGDGKADALVRLYIDGKLRGEGYNSYNLSYTADRVTRARLYSYNASSFTTYLDNVTLEQFNMDTAAHEHVYGDEWFYDEAGHYHKASCDSNPSCSTASTEKIPHTLDEEGYCVCGYRNLVATDGSDEIIQNPDGWTKP